MPTTSTPQVVPAAIPQVDPTPSAQRALLDRVVPAPPPSPFPAHLESLAGVITDAPPAYLEHLLQLSGGDAAFAISMHFDAGGFVPAG